MREIQTTLLPFHLDRKTVTVEEGTSISQMVDTLFPHEISGVSVRVMVDDQPVGEELWAELIPPVNSLVCINAIPAGGGGKKNPLVSILMIVVAIAAIVVAPYLAGALAPGLAAGSTSLSLITGVIQVGIGAIGKLAVGMLAGTPSQSSNARASDPTESTTQFIEGANNSINKYGVIPVNLGTNRMFPPQAALPYTEISSNLQYVRQLFTYGYGKHIITEKKFGDTLITEYDSIDMVDKLNGDLSSGTPLYTKDVYQSDYNLVLSSAAGYIVRTTQETSNEADVDITFPSGLTAYNDAGNRTNVTVDFEIQFAPTGTGNWSNGIANTAFGARSLTIPPRIKYINRGITSYQNNAHLVLLDIHTGEVTLSTYTTPGSTPVVPYGKIRIASMAVTTSATIIDERSSYIPTNILNSSSFIPTILGMTLNISAGTLNSLKFTVTGSTAEALRISKRLVFPTLGQYDVRLKRLTVDTVSDRTVDVARLTAIRSIKNISPVNQADISGSAIRILATDQLNGSIDNYNAICSTIIPFYDVDTDTWIEGSSSDPASLYRYVLQCKGFLSSKRLPDARINLVKLKEWSIYCNQRGLSYNRVIDYDTSIDEVLNDICAAGMATKHYVDGIYSVIIDNERPTIKGLVTPRNSWGYKGSITYPELPHAFRIQFRNPTKGYEIDERIVYQDGYTALNSTDFERIEITSCTDSSLAYYYGRRYLAALKLQPEIHTFNMDFENLAFNRGDRIQLINDVILVGVGQGRIKELTIVGPNVTGFVLDDTVDIPSINSFGARIRHADATAYNWYELNTSIGVTDTFTFRTPVAIASAPTVGSLCAFTEFSKQLDLLVLSISLDKNHNASISAINYAPQRFNADIEEIPEFTSNVISQIGSSTPAAPMLNGEIISDETVMSKNSDGSYTSRMVINLYNPNESTVKPIIKYQRVGETLWYTPDALNRSAETVILTGLDDGVSYNFKIQYQRQTGKMLISAPLFLNGITFVGASTIPHDVSTFKVSIVNSLGLFEWDKTSDVDIDHYVIKFTGLTTGVNWYSSQVIKDNIKGLTATIPIQKGTYLIKAVDILGNESQNPKIILNENEGFSENVVEQLIQQPLWSGVRDNCHVIDGELYLIDTTLPGYYYFDSNPLDLTEVYESYITASIQAIGTFYQRIRAVTSIRSLTTFRGIGGQKIRTLSSIRNVTSIRGINQSAWSISLEYSVSEDNIVWSSWSPLNSSSLIFRYIKFRLVLLSNDPLISPKVSKAEVKIDMPDRKEYGVDLNIPTGGLTVLYPTAFKINPAVTPVLQNGAVDDRIEYTSKNVSGFTIKVFNQTSGTYVSRVLDYVSTGYGRVI